MQSRKSTKIFDNTVISVSEALVYNAAEIKAEHAILYGDCFTVICAIEHSATIVTGDPEFKEVTILAPIKWKRQICDLYWKKHVKLFNRL